MLSRNCLDTVMVNMLGSSTPEIKMCTYTPLLCLMPFPLAKFKLRKLRRVLITAYGSTTYVEMTPKKMAATLKVHK